MDRVLRVLLYGSTVIQFADAAARFTRVPADKLYVMKGQTAKLTWDYHVDNINTEFDSQSPRWYFHNDSFMIGYGDAYDSWKFSIATTTCPSRLLTPTIRVSIEDKATLHIINVTLDDSGTYGCILLSVTGSLSSMPTSQTQLIVTETPKLTSKPKPYAFVIENSDLGLTCIAVGTPRPNVTWVDVRRGITLSKGVGTAELLLPNISRTHSGAYECHAINNPNERPVVAKSFVAVYYKPTVEKASSTVNISSWAGNTISLRCKWSSSNPIPNWTWYKPNGDRITNVSNIGRGSEVTVVTGDEADDYGMYTCKAANIAGIDWHKISVTRLYAAALFTNYPQKRQYILKGRTAQFSWDYHVDNIFTEFDPQSPRWYFHNNTSWWIGYGDVFDGRKFRIHKTCPPRLLTPKVRVSLEGKATLIISNVTLADSGTYTCRLLLRSGLVSSMPTSQAQLIVTVVLFTKKLLILFLETPLLKEKPTATTVVSEHSDLKITCTAVGYPTPNVTWVQILQSIKITLIKGKGTAVLHFADIKRNQSGAKYECHATNNPNEKVVRSRTLVIVYYKPTIVKSSSLENISSWSGNHITLRCNLKSSSLPSPTWTWYKPNGNRITNVRNITNGSEATVLTEESGDYGMYTCRAANIAGSDSININVVQLFPPGSPSFNVTNIEASSAVVRWAEPVDNGGSKVTEYKVEIDFKIYTIPSWKPNHFSIPDLTRDNLYVVKIYASNVAGYGKASKKTFTTRKAGPPASPVLKIIKVSPTTTTLSWSKPEENGFIIEYYKIYKKPVGDEKWLQVGALYVEPLIFTVIDLLPGKTYSFHVTAINKDGSSLMGVNVINVTLPAKTTTPHPTTSAITSSSGSRLGPCKDCDCSTKVTTLAAFLALAFVLNILLVVFISWKCKTNKRKNNNEISEHSAEADPGFSSGRDSGQSVEGAPKKKIITMKIQIRKNVNALGMTTLPPTVKQSSAGTRDPNQEHYQQLNPHTMQSRADAAPTYDEPVLDIATGERNDHHTYQALRNHTSVYQSLQTYFNVPNETLYLANGKTARFTWDFHVDNIKKELDSGSPRWYFYANSTTYWIGYGDAFNGRKFTIDTNTCPARFLRPTVRVSVEGKATLVIKNLTLADSGTYGCILFLAKGPDRLMPTSHVKLIVTGPPGSPVLKIVKFTNTTVTLMWSKPEENGGEIEYYTIYKKLAGAKKWLQVGTLSGEPLTYTVKELLPGKTYSFDVTAKNKDGPSLKGVNVKTVTLPIGFTNPPTTRSIVSSSGSRFNPYEDCDCKIDDTPN
ncbi:Immunoglobulin superfamily member 10 [Exaiptasia diaphana]|nr:Immunoglobulin superfamily member 10 [Exaiptasia diaphana]